MENMENRQKIRQENRKALPKFIAIMILSAALGAGLGLFSIFAKNNLSPESLRELSVWLSVHWVPWMMAGGAAVTLAVSLPSYLKTRNQIRQWDGTDETLAERIDLQLSRQMWFSGMVMIVNFLLLSWLFLGITTRAPGISLLAVGAFFLTMLLIVFFQQKMVDQTKLLYPEKQGSVYDMKFQNKWMDSCDEAEKLLIGRCAYKAFTACTRVCIALWLIFTFSLFIFDTGLLPVITVCLIWAVNQGVYSYWSIRYSKPGCVMQ